MTRILGEILRASAQWVQPETSELRLSIDSGDAGYKECITAFWLWNHSKVSVEPMVPPLPFKVVGVVSLKKRVA
jgi:hypothetical protein